MPNQYTKFRDASKHPSTRSFRWKQYKSSCSNDEESDKKKTQDGKIKRRISSVDSDDKLAMYQTNLTSPALLSPQSQLLGSGHRLDPFKVYPISPNKVELDIIDYYLNAVEPPKFPPRMIARSEVSSVADINPHLNMLLPFFMEHPVLFNAIITTCQASILISRGKSAYEDQTFLVHRARTVSKLRDKLGNNGFIDDAAILSVAMLLTSEYLIGNFKAITAHLNGLDEMIRVRGGLNDNTPWGQFVKNGVQGFKSVGGFFSGTLTSYCQESPLNQLVNPFIELNYPSHPFADDLCLKVSSLPRGFSNLILASYLSTQMIELVSAVEELHQGRFKDTAGPTSDALMSSLHIALQRFSQNSKVTHIERCVYAGLLAHSFQFPLIRTPNLFHDPPLQNFVHILSQQDYRATTVAERHVMIWIHIAVEGIMALRTTRIPGSREIFAEALKKYPEMRNWERLEQVIRDFFYTDDLLQHWKLQWTRAIRWNTPISMGSPASDTAQTIVSGSESSSQWQHHLSIRESPHSTTIDSSQFTQEKSGSMLEGKIAGCPFHNMH